MIEINSDADHVTFEGIPQDVRFARYAVALGGKRDGGRWIFQKRLESTVLALCFFFFKSALEPQVPQPSLAALRPGW